jgi:lipoate-protein ligase B
MDVPVLEYNAALDLQHRLVAARIDGTIDRDIILLLEHTPVFTLGRRGGLDNLKVSEAFLGMREISLVQVERGGDITYHGPGQLVVYPIVDLRAGKYRIVQFVDRLEEIMIRTLSDWGILADRNPINRGVWVGSAKIGSLGIALRRSVSFHGFALNVNISLEPFGWINPCGLEGIRITSMQQELNRKVVIEDVRRVIGFNFQEVFGVKTVGISLDEIHGLLGADDRTVVEHGAIVQPQRHEDTKITL